MDYPLMIDGNDAGTLSVSEEGLYTCFEAHAGEHDGLVRLWRRRVRIPRRHAAVERRTVSAPPPEPPRAEGLPRADRIRG